MFQKSKRKIGSDSEDEGGDAESRKGSDKEDEEEKPEGEAGAEGGAGESAVLPNVSDDDSDTDKPSSNR